VRRKNVSGVNGKNIEFQPMGPVSRARIDGKTLGVTGTIGSKRVQKHRQGDWRGGVGGSQTGRNSGGRFDAIVRPNGIRTL